jgi:uncharacterized protein (DUF2267 family)
LSDAQYDWEVQAALYYDAHKDEFKNTPPATQATTQPDATQPAVASSQPAFKPFDEVKRQIIEKLAASQIDQQTKMIAADLASRLSDDFTTIRKTNPASVLPTTMPSEANATTQPTTDVMTLARLETLRAEIEKKYHVAIQLHDLVKDWQTTKDLVKLPGIGTASSPDGASFSEYATNFSRSSLTPGSGPLQLWEPSQPIADAEKNTFVFRLTAAQAAHPPADVTTVAKQVEQDWKLLRAYEQAKTAAQTAFEAAKKLGLSQAARAAGQNMFATPLFPPRRVQEVPGYRLPSPVASQQLLSAAVDLVQQASVSDKHPVQRVDLPNVQRVVIIELAGVQLDAPEWQAQWEVTESQQHSRLQKLAQDFFNYDNVVARTGYKAEEKS